MAEQDKTRVMHEEGMTKTFLQRGLTDGKKQFRPVDSRRRRGHRWTLTRAGLDQAWNCNQWSETYPPDILECALQDNDGELVLLTGTVCLQARATCTQALQKKFVTSEE